MTVLSSTVLICSLSEINVNKKDTLHLLRVGMEYDSGGLHLKLSPRILGFFT